MAVMRDGVIVQCDSPMAVYDRPAPAELRGRPVLAGARAESGAVTGRLRGPSREWGRASWRPFALTTADLGR